MNMHGPEPGATSEAIVHFNTTESGSGIWWKSAREGLTLLLRAFHESQTPCADTPLIRRLYIDGLTYLLRGLPMELSCEETCRLREAIPRKVLAVPTEHDRHLEREDEAAVIIRAQAAAVARQAWLEYTAEAFTYYAIIGIALALPWLRWLAGHCRRWNERYEIWPRLEARCTASAESVALNGFRMANAAWALRNGKYGKAFRKSAKCGIKQVGRGV